MAFVVDRFHLEDLGDGLRLSTQAGWNQEAADWKRVLDLCPDGLFAGRLDGRVVATASVAAIGPKIRWIGLILVDESVRGQGYGSLMMDHALARARRAGDEIVGLDASDLGRPVYLKKGFVDVAPIDRWAGSLRAGGDPRNVGRIGLESFDPLAELDRKACGVDRSPLLRNLLGDPEVVCVASHGKGMEGFAFLLPGRTSPHVGPVVASDGAVLNALLGALARHLNGASFFIDALRTPANSEALEGSGLTIARRLTRMTLGAPHQVLMGPLVRAAVSFTWG
jgi:GNAT superfamily N-acetyltransferase